MLFKKHQYRLPTGLVVTFFGMLNCSSKRKQTERSTGLCFSWNSDPEAMMAIPVKQEINFPQFITVLQISISPNPQLFFIFNIYIYTHTYIYSLSIYVQLEKNREKEF